MESDNSQPPTDATVSAQASPRARLPVSLLIASVYGVFISVWYAIAIYLLVFGDNSSTFGLYAILPAAIVTLLVTIWLYRSSLRGNRIPVTTIAIATAPISLLFTYNVIRFGV